MDHIRGCLDEIVKLHEAIMQALTKNEAQVVADLVYQQCVHLNKIQSFHFTAEHREMAEEVLSKVELQQSLINQATEVANFFLVRLHGASRFEAIG